MNNHYYFENKLLKDINHKCLFCGDELQFGIKSFPNVTGNNYGGNNKGFISINENKISFRNCSEKFLKFNRWINPYLFCRNNQHQFIISLKDIFIENVEIEFPKLSFYNLEIHLYKNNNYYEVYIEDCAQHSSFIKYNNETIWFEDNVDFDFYTEEELILEIENRFLFS